MVAACGPYHNAYTNAVASGSHAADAAARAYYVIFHLPGFTFFCMDLVVILAVGILAAVQAFRRDQEIWALVFFFLPPLSIVTLLFSTWQLIVLAIENKYPETGDSPYLQGVLLQLVPLVMYGVTLIWGARNASEVERVD